MLSNYWDAMVPLTLCHITHEDGVGMAIRLNDGVFEVYGPLVDPFLMLRRRLARNGLPREVRYDLERTNHAGVGVDPDTLPYYDKLRDSAS